MNSEHSQQLQLKKGYKKCKIYQTATDKKLILINI